MKRENIEQALVTHKRITILESLLKTYWDNETSRGFRITNNDGEQYRLTTSQLALLVDLLQRFKEDLEKEYVKLDKE